MKRSIKTELETLLWSERIRLLEKRLTEPTLLEMSGFGVTQDLEWLVRRDRLNVLLP